MRRAMAIIVVVLVLGFAGIATAVNSNSIVEDGIEYYMQTDKAVYSLGENVEMLYRVTNLRNEYVTFQFAVQQQCHFEVSDGETRIWSWPKLVNPAGSSFTLRPGGFKQYFKDWNMMNENGTPWLPDDDFPASPGIYYTSAQLMGGGTDGTIPERVSVAIRIIPESAIEAAISIDPNTLNLASKGKWLTCYIWLPEGYDVADIEPNSVRLEDVIAAEWMWFEEEDEVAMAKFDRSEVQEMLEAGEMVLTVSGELNDGTRFEGTDAIRVIDKGRSLVNSNSIVQDDIEYYMQTDKPVYHLGENVEMLYKVTNLGHGFVRFEFYVGPVDDRCDFIVEKDGERIWDNLDRPVTLMLTSFILGPSQSRDFTLTWDMTDLNGNQIVPGNYDVTGALSDLWLGYEDRRVPVSVEIKIIPGKKKR